MVSARRDEELDAAVLGAAGLGPVVRDRHRLAEALGRHARAVDAAVRVLEKEGISCAFGVPGAAINPLYSALKLRGSIRVPAKASLKPLYDPANLRIKAAEMDEAGWLKYTGALHTRPLMPDFALRAMCEDDRRAIYRFIRSLGAGGAKAPDYLPPGKAPPLPYMQMVLPPMPQPAAAAAPEAG